MGIVQVSSLPNAACWRVRATGLVVVGWLLMTGFGIVAVAWWADAGRDGDA